MKYFQRQFSVNCLQRIPLIQCVFGEKDVICANCTDLSIHNIIYALYFNHSKRYLYPPIMHCWLHVKPFGDSHDADAIRFPVERHPTYFMSPKTCVYVLIVVRTVARTYILVFKNKILKK